MGAASSEGASSGIACVSRASLEKTIASAFLIVVRASSRLVSLARSSAQLSAMSVSSERPFVMVYSRSLVLSEPSVKASSIFADVLKQNYFPHPCCQLIGEIMLRTDF